MGLRSRLCPESHWGAYNAPTAHNWIWKREGEMKRAREKRNRKKTEVKGRERENRNW